MSALSPQHVFDLAFRHHQAGRLREAEQLYRQVTAQQPGHADAIHLLGMLAHQTGRNDLAADLMRQAIALRPHNAEAHSNLGNVLREQGKFDEAISACRQAIAIKPLLPEAHNNLGNALREKGQLEDAIAAYRQAIALRPSFAEAHSNLGVALKSQGKLDEAIAEYRRAIACNPRYADAHCNLGSALRDQGQLDEAICACEQAIILNPRLWAAYSNLGSALREKNELDRAIAAFRQAIALRPNDSEAYGNLGCALADRGEFDRAILAHRQGIALNPDCAEAICNLGNALRDKGRLDEAKAAYRRAIAIRPHFPEAFSNLGNALRDEGLLDESIAAYRQAIALRPGYAKSEANLGNALKDAGQLEEAIASFRRAIELDPSLSGAHSNLIYTLHFHSAYDAEAIAEEHRHWNRVHAAPLRSAQGGATGTPDPLFANDPGVNRRLRIGYISPDFRQHPVGRFFMPLIDQHDRGAFEIFCYSEVGSHDLLTERIRSRADVWRRIVGMTDEAVADRIREDKIDILVDLTMHMAHNRLLAFARKPAPVQVTYLAYCSTTGLDAMDYRLTDPHLDPPAASPAEQRIYSEKSIRLPDTYWCYQPGPEAAEVAPLPALTAGYITFGCLNNFAKTSPEALSTWIEILRALPSSRLQLHARQGEHRRRTLDRLQQQGIDASRLTFIDFLQGRDYFRQYNQIDIALDPFPYAGGTTSCDAMWMGVPIITLAGRTAVGRSGVSLLANLDLPELIAQTPQAYVQKSADLANNLTRLAELRAGLRARMLRSPLMDAPKFARDVETAYREIWLKWRETVPQEH